jgi:hypothetical protein
MLTAVEPHLPAARPACPADSGHGPMELRPLSRQTYEQQWCGVWYDCPRCYSSALLHSPIARRNADQRRQSRLAAQRKRGRTSRTAPPQVQPELEVH